MEMTTSMVTKTRRGTKRFNWGTAIFLVVAHLAAIAAIFFWSWPALISALILYWVAGSLGIGMGFHRLITHRGYRVPKPIEYFLVTCGTLALEGGPIQWVTTHRIHHAHTDRAGDPHTPRDGGWWAHIGWILRGTAQDHDQATLERYAPDLIKNRFYVLLDRFYYVPLIILAVLMLRVWENVQSERLERGLIKKRLEADRLTYENGRLQMQIHLYESPSNLEVLAKQAAMVSLDPSRRVGLQS